MDDREGSSYEAVTELQSVLQPIIKAAKFCKTWQMGFLYAPMIFAGNLKEFVYLSRD